MIAIPGALVLALITIIVVGAAILGLVDWTKIDQDPRDSWDEE